MGWVYEGLTSAITVRHYSPKALDAYKIWTKKFQTFTQSKDPRLLSMEDVKGFLSFLAVAKKIAASSQNQAFNALLFLFRHVLEREFGNVEGVVRAERRRTIPVVLSREEVDCIVGRLDAPYALVAKLLYGCGLRLPPRESPHPQLSCVVSATPLLVPTSPFPLTTLLWSSHPHLARFTQIRS